MQDHQILDELRKILSEVFEIAPDRVKPDAHLFEDLELDSIDAVDLAVKLQNMTGKRIKPADFKTVRTVDDVIQAVHTLMAA